MGERFDPGVDDGHVKREREKARELRKTQWWKERIAEGVCHYCGKKTNPDELTLDHVIPVSRGGKSTRGNCVPCCKACNSSKKALTPAEQILNELFPDGGMEY